MTTPDDEKGAQFARELLGPDADAPLAGAHQILNGHTRDAIQPMSPEVRAQAIREGRESRG